MKCCCDQQLEGENSYVIVNFILRASWIIIFTLVRNNFNNLHILKFLCSTCLYSIPFSRDRDLFVNFGYMTNCGKIRKIRCVYLCSKRAFWHYRLYIYIYECMCEIQAPLFGTQDIRWWHTDRTHIYIHNGRTVVGAPQQLGRLVQQRQS